MAVIYRYIGVMKTHICGVYFITQKSSGKIYVGASARIPQRWVEHRSKLRRGSHWAPALQSAWDSCGPHDFEFRLIEAVSDPAQLSAREQWWIDTTRAYPSGFNVRPTAESNRGMVWSPESNERRRKSLSGRNTRSPEAIERAAVKQRQHKRTEMHQANINAAVRAAKKRPDVLERMSRAAQHKLTDEQVRSIRDRHAAGTLQKALAEEYRVSAALISCIVNRTRYAHLD